MDFIQVHLLDNHCSSSQIAQALRILGEQDKQESDAA